MTSTTKPDYWSILGIQPGSDINLIKSAFRSEARRWHPDLNINDSNAEERFKLINEAYAVLSDPKKRLSWESQNSNVSHELFSSGFPSYEEYINVVLGIRQIDDNDEEESDINYQRDPYQYEDTYTSQYKPTASPVSPPPIKQLDNVETLVDLSPDEALHGSTVEIQLSTGPIVEFHTPAYAGDGWRLRLPGLSSDNKDHFIHLRVQTRDGLRIDGLRVLYRLELFPHDALFGCGIEIPTLDGFVVLQVPPKSSSGRLLRLRGRGLEFDGSKGDQLVEIVVVVPSELGESERALYERLQELSFRSE